jgi:hypothetical protein
MITLIYYSLLNLCHKEYNFQYVSALASYSDTSAWDITYFYQDKNTTEDIELASQYADTVKPAVNASGNQWIENPPEPGQYTCGSYVQPVDASQCPSTHTPLR